MLNPRRGYPAADFCVSVRPGADAKKGGGQAKKRKIPENVPERGAVDSQSPAGDNGGNA